VALRYFNVFGPRQALDDEYAVVVPKFINCMLKSEQPPIYGTGKQSRDFTFVANVVSANLLAARNNKIKSGVFNVASGKDYSVLEVVANLNNILKKNIKPVFLNKRPGDVFRTSADLSSSSKVLGFRPKVDFIKGLTITVSYWRENA
jgi:UDP-glucose 4-epimerase